MRRRKSLAIRWQIVGAFNAGASRVDIARQHGITRGEVSRLIRKWHETGTVCDRPRSGRPRKSTRREDRLLLRMARQNRFLSANHLRNTWQQHLGVRVSREMVNKRLLAGGYKSRRPRRQPKLTRAHKAAHLRWVTYHQHWNICTWRRILWSDESKFNVFNADGR